ELVGLLRKLSLGACKAPEGKDPWAARLTDYVDSRSGRRRILLRVWNLNEQEARFSSTHCAESPHARLDWPELVEKCVRLYFGEELPRLSVSPAPIHARVWKQIPL